MAIPKSLATYNLYPNFSIILPGKCNANCEFCFWKEEAEDPDFLNKLKTTLMHAPTIFHQVSITGGEPCLSPQLVPVLKLLDKFKTAKRIDKVVLTTNGTALLYKLSRHKCMRVLDAINISRHRPIHEENLEAFNADFLPDEQELTEACQVANMMGIPVTFNVVIDEYTDKQLIEDMIILGKKVGVTHCSFRRQHGSLDPTPVEAEYKDYANEEQKCPVCRTKEQFLNGMLINWKCSIPEPINAPSFKKGKMVYEAVFHPTGELTADWVGKYPIKFASGAIFEGTASDDDVEDALEKLYDNLGIGRKKPSITTPPPTLYSAPSGYHGCGIPAPAAKPAANPYRGCGGGGAGGCGG